MTHYTGKARDALARTLSPPTPKVRVMPWGLVAWSVVGLAFLWFSCCGGAT